MAENRRDRSHDDRVEQALQRIAAALDIPVETFLADAALSLSSRPPVKDDPGAEHREPAAASDRATTVRRPPAQTPDHARQGAEMLALFDRVSDPVDREICLSFVRACTVR